MFTSPTPFLLKNTLRHIGRLIFVLSVVTALPSLRAGEPGKNISAELAPGVPLDFNWLPGLNCWVGRYLVTQVQFQALMGNNPSYFKGPQRPVDSATWNEAMEFCKHATKVLRDANAIPAGAAVTLPTEKQWEYFVGDAKPEDSIYDRWTKAGPLGTAPVGSKPANQYGLYDTRGQVFEWCLDKYGTGGDMVLRGGSWLSQIDTLQINYRGVHHIPAYRQNVCGFRVVLKPAA